MSDIPTVRQAPYVYPNHPCDVRQIAEQGVSIEVQGKRYMALKSPDGQVWVMTGLRLTWNDDGVYELKSLERLLASLSAMQDGSE